MSDNRAKSPPLNVVIYWHMHQPEYRDLRSGEYHQPWTYLHTIKDYVDMVAHLENCKDARAVVNFAPVLLEQIDDYARQLKGYLHQGKSLRDPLLAALADPVLSLNDENRISIIKACLRANENRMVDRFPAFKTLYEMAKAGLKERQHLVYYSDQFLADLLVWYHLSWTAETVRIHDKRITGLMKKARNFSLHDRRQLVEIFYELISGVIGRYRKLSEAGRIELSMTPYAHPIIPLLIDIKSARQAMPDVELPVADEYPGGLERSRWHMRKGKEVFMRHFGFEPDGCWPSEGSISTDMVKLCEESGVKWLASGETVLRNSLGKSSIAAPHCIHTPFHLHNTNIKCFFRDDGLSDLIGFKYFDWHADDAVANLVHHLENIAEKCTDKSDAIVSIILDGENAWEYYPENGIHFLTALYENLSKNEGLKMTTYGEYLRSKHESEMLNDIVAGSWVYGTFSTWIGEKDKNRAWDMLVDAKKIFDRVVAAGKLTGEELQLAVMQLATCESSDWFWWFGEYNSAESVAAFDEQYRLHLSNLYQLLHVEPPEYLAREFSFGSVENTAGGTMLPGQQQ